MYILYLIISFCLLSLFMTLGFCVGYRLGENSGHYESINAIGSMIARIKGRIHLNTPEEMRERIAQEEIDNIALEYERFNKLQVK